MTATYAPLTALESAALVEIDRRGGALPGSRTNTLTTRRLVRLGLVRYTDAPCGVIVTAAGLERIAGY